MPNRRIQGPEGFIDFPDSMNDSQIEQAIQKLYPPKRGPELQLPALARDPTPQTPFPSPIGSAPEPSLWQRGVSAASKMPLVNTISPYGISRGAGVGEVAGLGGYSKATQGVEEMFASNKPNPQLNTLAEGAARAGSGAFEAMTPLMIAGGLSSPLAFGAGMVGSELGGEAGRRGAKAAGFSPEAQEFWGVAGSALGGSMAGGVEGWREFKSRQVESLFEQHVQSGMDPASARAAAENAHANYRATGNSKFLNPFGEQPTTAELEQGTIKGPAKVAGQQLGSAAQGIGAAGLIQKGEDHSKDILAARGLDTPQVPRENIPTADKSTRLPDPLKTPEAPSASPMPGSAEYEALRRKVDRLEGTKTVDSPEVFGRPAPPDYRKSKLSLTRTGDTFVYRKDYTDNTTMGKRSMERYRIAMHDLGNLEKAGADPARVEQVKTEALRALTTWGQYATREDVDATLATLRTTLEEKGSQLAKARDLTSNLLQGKTSFSKLKPGADTITRADYTKIAGHDLPSIPKGFVDTLPKDIRDFIEGAKPSEGKEMIVRQWAAKYLTDRMLGVMDEHTKTSEIAAAIAKGKQIDPASISRYLVLPKEVSKPAAVEVPIEQATFNYARSATKAGVKFYGAGNFKVTEKAGKFRVERLGNQTPAQPEVGRSPGGTQETKPPAESVPPAQAPEGPGEPVRAAERSPVEPLPAVQKIEGSLRVTDESARSTIERDLERRGITPPGVNLGRRAADIEAERTRVGSDNPAAIQARMDAIASQPKETGMRDWSKEPREPKVASNPVLSEKKTQTPPPAPTPEQGLADQGVFNDLVRSYMKKGMAQGTAETMARNKMERERGSFSLWQARAGSVPLHQQVITKLLEKLGSVTDKFTTGPEEQQGRNIMRSVFGERARSIDQLYTKFGDAMREHDGDSINDLIRFNNAAERKPGSSFLNAKDQAIADSFQDIYQNILWPTLQQINPDKFGPGIENYFGRLFKGKNGQISAQAVVLSRSPFEGGKAFSKQRVYDWIDQSIAAGAEPVTTNPVKMQALVMSQIVKYISAHKAFEEMKDKDLISWVKLGGQRNPGWRQIDDSIFKPRVPGQGGLVEHGNYYAHPDIAKIFNRWVTPGLRGNALYDPLRGLADNMNMIQLGFSGFHFTFTSVAGAATSDVALGLQQMFSFGKPLAGAKSMLKGLTIAPSAIDTYRLGHLMQEEWLVPGTHPWLSKYADLMENVGGGIGSTSLLTEGQRVAKFRSAFKQGDVYSSLKTGLPAIAEWSSKLLMQNYVPNLKMGAFAKLAMEQYDTFINKGASPDQVRTELGRTWDSIDNRFGLLRYDNRFWNKTARDLAQLTVRSVGWNWGTLSELFGGTTDIGGLLRGKELSTKAAYVMALPMVIGTMGAVMHYGMTGQAPQKLEDYFYPGPDGAKISLPGYHREAFSVIRSLNASERQGDNFLNKIHPLVQQMYEMWSNQDYYGTEIRHKGDSTVAQAAELGKYFLSHNLPLPLQSAEAQYDKTAGDWRSTANHFLAGEAGFFPAPKWVGQTKAEQETFDYAKRQWAVGPRTTAEFTRRQTMYQLRWQMDNNKFDGSTLARALESGRITQDDALKIMDEASDHLTPFQREFKSIGLVPQLDILTKYATDDEKAQLYPLLKLDTMPTLLPEVQAEAERKLDQLEK